MIEYLRDLSSTQPGLKSPLAPEKNSNQKAYNLQRTGDDFFTASRFDAAKDFYQKSLEAYQTAGDSHAIAATLQRLGRAEELIGDYRQARLVFLQSLHHYETLSHLQGIARSKAHLGNTAWALGEYESASKVLDEAKALYRIGEDRAGEAWVLDLMGNLRLAMRDDAGAERFHAQAFELIGTLGVNLENLAWNDYHFGAIALFRGQVPGAKDYFFSALKCFTKLKDDLGRVASLTHLGEIACEQGDFAGAEKNLRQAVKLVLPTQCKPLLADVLTAVARLMKDLGDDRKAVSLLMVALSHPTCRQQTKDRMIRLTLALNAHFSEAEARKGFDWARSVSLEEVAAAWAAQGPRKSK